MKCEPISFIGIKKNQEFRTILNKGKKAVAEGLVLFCLNNDLYSKTARIGFIASKKVGNAVERNRVKRRLRAACREIIKINNIINQDYVIVGRKSTLTLSYTKLLNDIKYTLRKCNTC